MSPHGQQLSAPVNGAHQIEQVLLGLADGSYVLSTPEGAVAECGAGVVALLDAPAEALAGGPTADALVAGADAATRAAFEQLLQVDGAGGAAPRVFRTETAAGAHRSLQFVVVAVPLALGWEFTSLLSELGSRDAGTWRPEALRLRHGRALEAIEGVCISGAQPDPGARLAGILIVVRDVDAPPLTREDVGRRMAEQRASARAAAAEAARRADAATGRPAIAADPPQTEVAGLEDLVERARVLRERVEESERDAAAAIAEREQALAQLAVAQAERAAETERREAGDGRTGELAAERDEARTRAQAAEAQTAALRGIADAARAEADAARADAERAQAELSTARDELRDARSESALTRGQLTAMHGELESASASAALDAAHRELDVTRGEELAGAQAERDALRAELATARRELAGTGAELDGVRGKFAGTGAELDGVRGELAGTRAELDGVRGELESTRTELDGVRGKFAGTGAELDGVRGELESTRAELDGVRGELESTRTELEATLAAAEGAWAEREQARIRANQLLSEAESARAAAEAIRAEFAFDEPHAAAPPSLSGVDGPGSGPASAPAPAPALELPPCASGEAVALLGLDGTFKRLDDAFCSLLGCREEDLRAARWPSIIDRENLAAHQEIARALRAGEIDSAPVETVYMHAQGLLVPIAGTVSMHRAGGGAATHFLFRADVSRTSGSPLWGLSH